MEGTFGCWLSSSIAFIWIDMPLSLQSLLCNPNSTLCATSSETLCLANILVPIVNYWYITFSSMGSLSFACPNCIHWYKSLVMWLLLGWSELQSWVTQIYLLYYMGAPLSCIVNSLCSVGDLNKSMSSCVVGHTQNQSVNGFISYDIFPST